MNVHIERVPRPSKKHQLIDGGMETVRRNGLVGSSIRDVTTGAEVPLGSFSNHFPSKEAFGVAVIDRYFADVRAVIAETLDDTSRPPLVRLRAYFDAITERLATRGWHDGCLIGNTSLDSTESSEAIRTRLQEVFNEWHRPLRATSPPLRRTESSFCCCRRPTSPTSSWPRGRARMLRMKVERSPAPLEHFNAVVFGRLPRARDLSDAAPAIAEGNRNGSEPRLHPHRRRSTSAAPRPGPRNNDQLCRHRDRRSVGLPPRQSDVVVPVAQHHPLRQRRPPLPGSPTWSAWAPPILHPTAATGSPTTCATWT